MDRKNYLYAAGNSNGDTALLEYTGTLESARRKAAKLAKDAFPRDHFRPARWQVLDAETKELVAEGKA
jgi:hypothetical protein